MAYDQHDTPYVDAALRYRAHRLHALPHPGPQARQGSPGQARELLGDTCLSVDIAMAGGVEDTRESTQLIRLAEDYAAEAWGSDRAWFLVNGSSSGIHALMLTLCGPVKRSSSPATRTSPCWPGSSSAAPEPAYMEPEIDRVWGIPLNVTVRRRAARAGGAPRGEGALRDLAHVQRPRGRPRGHRRARARSGRALRHRPGLGPAPALLQPAAHRRDERGRRRRRGQHAQAHQRHHADLGAHGPRHARQRGHGSWRWCISRRPRARRS